MPHEVKRRRLADTLLVDAVDSFRRVLVGLAQFHFDEGDRAAALRDNVDFPLRRAKAPFQNSVALATQI